MTFMELVNTLYKATALLGLIALMAMASGVSISEASKQRIFEATLDGKNMKPVEPTVLSCAKENDLNALWKSDHWDQQCMTQDHLSKNH